MDGLALLCNLFADGPVTLRRLRAARVRSLDELERLPPAELAAILHAALPQAGAFAEEGRKLGRRLAETSVPRPPVRAAFARGARRAAPVPAAPRPVDDPGATPLRAGLVAGLDEALVTRLAAHGVRTLRSLIEFAGLDLARRTGIPYATLLELARRARRVPDERTPGAGFAHEEPARELRVEVLVPAPRPAPAQRVLPEAVRSDEFTLPVEEPESAGPFG